MATKSFTLLMDMNLKCLRTLRLLLLKNTKIYANISDVRDNTIGKAESALWSALHLQFVNKVVGDRFTVVQSITKPP